MMFLYYLSSKFYDVNFLPLKFLLSAHCITLVAAQSGFAAGTAALLAVRIPSCFGRLLCRPQRAQQPQRAQRAHALEGEREQRRGHHDDVQDVERRPQVGRRVFIHLERVHLQEHLEREEDGEQHVHDLERDVRLRAASRKRVRLRGEQTAAHADGEQDEELEKRVRRDAKREETPGPALQPQKPDTAAPAARAVRLVLHRQRLTGRLGV